MVWDKYSFLPTSDKDMHKSMISHDDHKANFEYKQKIEHEQEEEAKLKTEQSQKSMKSTGFRSIFTLLNRQFTTRSSNEYAS